MSTAVMAALTIAAIVAIVVLILGAFAIGVTVALIAVFSVRKQAKTAFEEESKNVMPDHAEERERAKNAHYMANLMNYDGEEQLEFDG